MTTCLFLLLALALGHVAALGCREPPCEGRDHLIEPKHVERVQCNVGTGINHSQVHGDQIKYREHANQALVACVEAKHDAHTEEHDQQKEAVDLLVNRSCQSCLVLVK